jgi:transcriptional regulator
LTLYIPKHFTGTATDARALIDSHPFATLMTAAAGTPHVTHLPLFVENDALVGHMARANPHWQHFGAGDTVAVFHGPHAFISRGWYADAANNVPTWNFATAHVTGRPELLDAAATRAAVEKLEARYESPSLPRIVEAKMGGLIGGIVGFRLPMSKVEVKLKFSQNKSQPEIESLVAGLKAAGDPDSLKTAEQMRERR